MALNLLALPVDIPWQLIATSEDMYAISADDPLPSKWRSSVGVYSYEPVPDPDQPADPNETTTYLKVVASVTGYQPDGPEIDSSVLNGQYGTAVIDNINDVAATYFPAYSALLQVAVYPQGTPNVPDSTEGNGGNGGGWAILDYPYFADFEPKKRELIELVTDTGESLTQSASDINVRKGTTSVDQTENVNIDRGGSFGLNVNTPYGGGGFTYSHQQDVGSTGSLSTSAVNVVTTDASREKRETYSHQTNLSQLYHLLDSYHAATNRAVFFLNARPHLKDSPYTFVNGPRYLEGVQEFFLVVRRPKTMPSFCVKAVLETAHLRETDVTVTTGDTVYDQEQLNQSFTLRCDGGTFSADDAKGQWTMNVPGGFVLDRTRGGGTYSGWGGTVNIPAGVSWTFSATTESGHESEALPQITTYDDHIDIRAHVYGTANLGGGTDGSGTYNITMYTRSANPIQTPQTTTERYTDLFITAREVTSCPEVSTVPDYLSFERPLDADAVRQMVIARGSGTEAITAANAVGRLVRDHTALSLTSPQRYQPGAVDFLTSNTFLNRVRALAAKSPDPRLSVPLVQIAPDDLRPVLEQYPHLTVRDALSTTGPQLADSLRIAPDSARRLLALAAGVTPPVSGTPSARRAGTPSSSDGNGGTGDAAR